mmetsp:Transcript_7464/g.16233  ORF Transcript_7464/g.16233 Transcript_7464/m.16233 type:complete len:185 (-) Transcript_7464:71-625(-)
MPRGRSELTKYQGWPKGIYPMSDGWVPPAYPGEEELVAYEEKMNARRKAVLVKRHICVKEPQLEQLKEKSYMDKSEYSINIYPIKEGPYSGPGDEKTYWLIVYYETSKKAKVERAFKALGSDISEYEQVPVDPDTQWPEEKRLMYSHGEAKYEIIEQEYDYVVVEGEDAKNPWGPSDPNGPWFE